MFKFLDEMTTFLTERLTDSVEHMSIAQWGIVAAVALMMGFVMLKGRS